MFGKTSLDALLDCLENADRGEPVLSDGRDRDSRDGVTFPVFPDSGPLVSAALVSQALAEHQASLAQTMYRQQQGRPGPGLPKMLQQPVALLASVSAPCSPTMPGNVGKELGSGATLKHPRLSSDAFQDKRIRASLNEGDKLPRPPGPPTSSGPDSADTHAYQFDGQSAQRQTRPDMRRQPSDGDGDIDTTFSWRPSKDAIGDIQFPRASLASLGACAPSYSVGANAMEMDCMGDAPDKRKEKNRIAQRRFRERQKTTVATLQTELDGKELEIQRMSAELRMLDQANRAMMATLIEYERTFGSLPLLHHHQ